MAVEEQTGFSFRCAELVEGFAQLTNKMQENYGMQTHTKHTKDKCAWVCV